jgi:hypothetical protein
MNGVVSRLQANVCLGEAGETSTMTGMGAIRPISGSRRNFGNPPV